jgi:hypothetical protein
MHPAARQRRLGGQHPVEQDAVGDRSAQVAQPWSHRCDDDSCLLREELTQLADGALDGLDRRAQLAGPDPDAKPRGIEPEAVDRRSDSGRLMSVEGKDPHAELELRSRSGELCERLQARRSWLVVRPQRVVSEMLTLDG